MGAQDLSDPLQVASLSDDEAHRIGGPDLVAHRDAVREQVAQAAGTTPDTFWGRTKQAVSDIGHGVADFAGAAKDKAGELLDKAAPYTTAATAAALLPVAGPLGAYAAYKGAGGQEATNDQANADLSAAQARHAQQAAAFEAAGAPPTSKAGKSPGGGIGMPSNEPMEKAFQAQKAAGQQTLEAQAAQQAQVDKGLAEAQRQQGVMAAQAAIDHANREREVNKAKNQAEDWARQYSEGKIDKDAFYKNEDGTTNYGRKVGAAIAVAMGQLGSALAGGPNVALQIINKSIDDDIAAQQANLAKTRDVAKSSQEKADNLAAQDEHLMDRDAKYRMQAYADARQNIQDMANSTTDQEKKAKLAELDANIQTQQAEASHKYAMERADLGIKNRQLALETERTAAATGRGAVSKEEKQQQNVNGIVDNLKGAFKSKTGFASFISQYLPGTDAKQYGDDRNAAAVALAKSTGRTTPELIKQIKDLIPEASDSEGRAANKFKSLRNFLGGAEEVSVPGEAD